MARDIYKICGRDCKFDPIKDYQEVETGLVVDLSETLKTGIVKESNTVLESNDISDPDSIVGVVRDRFDAIEAERAIRKYGKKADVSQYVKQEGVPPASTQE